MPVHLRQLAVLLLILCGLPAQAVEEVPFITTPENVTLEMLRIAQVGPSDHVIDLGSGDGRIVITAARSFGARGLGVEIVPELVRQSIGNAQRAGVAERAAFREQDIFQTDLSAATVVTLYLLPEVNLQLRPRLLALAPGTRIVSHDWDMGDWRPDRTLTVPVPDKAVGLDKSSRVHLWRVPAPVDGLWCAAGGLRLRIGQAFQQFDAVLEVPQAPRLEWAGRIEGAMLSPSGGAPQPALAWSAPAAIQVTQGGVGLPAGTRFAPVQGGQCAL